MGRFINPFTDFGFKFLFGREVEKELLIDFLNDLLVGEHVITDIQFLNSEQQPEVKTERGLIYDIYCVTDTGERIIVEMQNREQPYFKDRALFYLSRAITQQAKRGVWNFQLDAVYGVFFMNFVMDKDIPSKIRTDVVLSDRDTGKLFNSKFRQIFIELPNFNKEEDECENDFERWIYILKHMDTLDRMPFKARKAVFERLEKLASKANMTQEERAQYEEEWKVYNDYFNTLDFAEKKGMQKGMQKEKEVTARIMKSKGVENFGIHAFLASNTVTNDYYPMLAKVMFELAVKLQKETGAHIKFINLSGGVGIPYKPDQEGNDIRVIGEGVHKVYDEVLVPAGMGDVAIYTEMGRFMMGPYGGLVTRAIHQKHIYKEYIGCDACAVNLMRPAMYGAYHHITVMGKEDQPCDHKYDVTGSLCENNDKFAIDRMLPEVEVGDLLFIHDTGAHGFSMGYNYNGKLKSAEVLLKEDGSFEVIRRAETPKDYFATLDGTPEYEKMFGNK